MSVQWIFRHYWTGFAKNGDPNAAGLVNWPAYTTATDQHIVLRDPVIAANGLAAADCDFWDGLPAATTIP